MTKQQILQQILDLQSIKNLVEVFQEVAALRMQAIRGSVLTSREFLEGLSDVFSEAKSNYDESSQVTLISNLNRNGRSVAIFTSANSGLYGDIINRTYDLFIDFVTKRQADAVILGKMGVKMAAERNPELLYNYFDLEDKGLDTQNFGLIMRYLLQFERIYVFHGKYKSLVNQDAIVTSISGDQVLMSIQDKKGEQNKYLFEPSIGDVLRTFEEEIMITLFQQTMHESQLAKFATRLFYLDQATVSIDDALVGAQHVHRKVVRAATARKQLNNISGISLWG